MTKQEREIRNMSNDELLEAFEANVDNQNGEVWKYNRVTQNTKKRYDAIKAEILRRMVG